MPEILTGAAAAREGNALPPRRQLPQETMRRVAGVARTFREASAGDPRAMIEFREAMARDDFGYLFGQALDRELMARYQALPSVWAGFARRTVVRDFKPKKYVDLIGGQGTLSAVEELAPYPLRAVSDAEYELSVGKYGSRFGISWESIINDDLDALSSLPDRLATAAVETEDYVGTSLLATAAGFDTSFFKAGNGNLISGNPALDVDSLSAALTAVGSRRDSDDRPVVVQTAVLMVPPALEVAARNILNATEVRLTQGSNTVIVGNWLTGRVRLVVNHWLPVIDKSANVNTTWYVLPDPSSARPAVAMGFLRGHETPDLRVKADTGMRVGGGDVPAEEGSYDVDDISYRVRHVTGGATLDPIATGVSDGSGG